MHVLLLTNSCPKPKANKIKKKHIFYSPEKTVCYKARQRFNIYFSIYIYIYSTQRDGVLGATVGNSAPPWVGRPPSLTHSQNRSEASPPQREALSATRPCRRMCRHGPSFCLGVAVWFPFGALWGRATAHYTHSWDPLWLTLRLQVLCRALGRRLGA